MIVDKLQFHNRNAQFIKKMMYIGLGIRILMLIIVSLSSSWEISFLGKGLSDDWKYEAGAEYFSHNANNLLDIKTFTRGYALIDNDWVGYHLSQPFSKATFWYLIVCFLVYTTKTKYSVRLLNVILSVISMKYIYNFTLKVYGQKEAEASIKLFTFLPYQVVFTCFGYKEELAMFCTFLLLSTSADYRYSNKNILKNGNDLVKCILASLLLLGIRSGISLVIISLCVLFIVLKPGYRLSKTQKSFMIFAFPIIFATLASVFIIFGDVFIHKMNAYLSSDGKADNAVISILLIRSPKDIWKLPLSYMFSIIQPFGLFKPLTSWASLIGNINIVMCPIAVSSVLYMFLCKKNDKIVYWGVTGYYLIYVVTSLNIFRHFGALIPLSLITSSAFYYSATYKEKLLFAFLSGTMIISLILFYIVR